MPNVAIIASRSCRFSHRMCSSTTAVRARARSIPSSVMLVAPRDARDLMNCTLFDTLDNAQFPIHGLAQHAECFLIGGTVVRGDRLCDAVEFNQNGTLAEAALINLRRHPAS